MQVSIKSKHKDVKFDVSFVVRNGNVTKGQRIAETDTWAEALAIAVAKSVMEEKKVWVDVIVDSRAGARHWLGDEGVSLYDEDPNAPIFERIEIDAKSLGTIG